MRAPLEHDTIDELSDTILAQQIYVEVATNAINRLDNAKLGPDAGVRLCKLAERLDLLAMRTVRAATSIRKLPAAARTPAYEWDLEAALAGRLTANRGHSIKRMHGIPAGTSFVVDDYWEGEQGVLIGVVWETPERPFTWLSPLEFRTCTRSSEG